VGISSLCRGLSNCCFPILVDDEDDFVGEGERVPLAEKKVSDGRAGQFTFHHTAQRRVGACRMLRAIGVAFNTHLGARAICVLGNEPPQRFTAALRPRLNGRRETFPIDARVHPPVRQLSAERFISARCRSLRRFHIRLFHPLIDLLSHLISPPNVPFSLASDRAAPHRTALSPCMAHGQLNFPLIRLKRRKL
jgi:hypothetical protein